MNPMLIIAGVVAFVLGIAGGTAVRVMTAPKHVAASAADRWPTAREMRRALARAAAVPTLAAATVVTGSPAPAN